MAQVIESDNLVDNAATVGRYLLDQLRELSDEFDCVANPRGRGLMCAFDLPSRAMRDQIRDACYERGLIILGCGERSIRFRPALNISSPVIDEGLAILREAMRCICPY